MDTENRFDALAMQWDANPVRVKLARDIADAILESTGSNGSETAMDFGAGTGLLTLAIAPAVATIFAADFSRGMLDVLMDKAGHAGLCNVQPLLWDPDTGRASGSVAAGSLDLIISAMAAHHVKDVENLASCFFDLLKSGGKAAIADLDPDGGAFHPEPGSFEHPGFERDSIGQVFSDAGFGKVMFRDAATVTRPVASGEMRTFGVFLLVAEKR